MEKLHDTIRIEEVIGETTKDLTILKNNITESDEKPLSIKEIQNFIEQYKGSPDELVDELYAQASNQKKFSKIVRKYKEQIKVPLGITKYRELFHYFFDQGYMLIMGEKIGDHTIRSVLVPYTKQKFSYSDYPGLGQLFDKQFIGEGEYYEITSKQRPEMGLSAYGRAIINRDNKSSNKKSIIINELMHATIFTHLYLSQGTNPLVFDDKDNEALSDIASCLSDIGYFTYILRFALMNTIAPQGGVDAGVKAIYEHSYTTIGRVFETVFNRTYPTTTFGSDLRGLITKLSPIPEPGTREYATFIDKIIQNYEGIIKDHEEEIKTELLKIGKSMIGEYKKALQKK